MTGRAEWLSCWQDDKKRNALSSTLMAELKTTLETLEGKKEVKVVVLRHDGKVFSSGHDLKELQTRQSTLGTTDPVFSLCSELMLTVRFVSSCCCCSTFRPRLTTSCGIGRSRKFAFPSLRRSRALRRRADASLWRLVT